VSADNGAVYRPRACGRNNGRIWEGWIEFAPVGGDAPVRTGVESEQPNRNDLMYWAEGLTQVFLEGALARALREPAYVERTVDRQPIFDAPKPHVANAPPRPRGTAVLDPFETYLQGKDVLHKQLHALETQRLRDIAVAYGLADRGRADGATRVPLRHARTAATRRVPTTARPDRPDRR
jgi:hypothetical protein